MTTASRRDAGFSLIELLIALGILLAVSSVVTQSVLRMSQSQKTIWNRTEMHSGVRSATELLQQEVGQAGRISLPGTVTLSAAVASGATTGTVSSSSGMFVNELLTVDAGANQEVVKITAIAGNTLTVSAVNTSGTVTQTSFGTAHAAGTAVTVAGGFQQGIIPDNITNGSDGTHLKLFGDINGDGTLVYVEYTCSPDDTNGGYLYRTMITNPLTAANKPAPGVADVLLGNIGTNPSSAPCFQYQKDTANLYVLDVAVTLTVRTQLIDPLTKTYQKETKALLNISPRNVLYTWQLHGDAYDDHVQATPTHITTNLLPPAS
jgi:prepilin-type N-terminal cleavage/methylation domain-containing protein